VARALSRRTEVVEVENPRDFVMARLMAARASLQAAVEAIDDAAGAFVNPESDKKGKDRKELVADALEATGSASRALEAAEGSMAEDFDAEVWADREPWEDDEDEEEDEDEEDEEDDDDRE